MPKQHRTSDIGSDTPHVRAARHIRIRDLPVPADIRDVIGADAEMVGMVRVESRRGSYALVIDTDWLDLAAQAQAIDPELVSRMTVPRPAIRAVIVTERGAGDNGAPTGHQRAVWWSDDGIPHLPAV